MTARLLAATLTIPLALLLGGCGTDCRKTMRDAEFEFTQRNFARAEKLFADAYKQNPAKCADAESRRAEALKFMGR